MFAPSQSLLQHLEVSIYCRHEKAANLRVSIFQNTLGFFGRDFVTTHQTHKECSKYSEAILLRSENRIDGRETSRGRRCLVSGRDPSDAATPVEYGTLLDDWGIFAPQNPSFPSIAQALFLGTGTIPQLGRILKAFPGPLAPDQSSWMLVKPFPVDSGDLCAYLSFSSTIVALP